MATLTARLDALDRQLAEVEPVPWLVAPGDLSTFPTEGIDLAYRIAGRHPGDERAVALDKITDGAAARLWRVGSALELRHRVRHPDDPPGGHDGEYRHVHDAPEMAEAIAAGRAAILEADRRLKAGEAPAAVAAELVERLRELPHDLAHDPVPSDD
jgi:hypothetical protein